MTINTINTYGGYESQRLDQLEQKLQEAKKSAAGQEAGSDRISISDEGRLKAAMLKTAQDSDGVRPDKVAGIKARIEDGTYEVKGRDVAAGLVRQELDVWG